eukprot:6159680-Pleurochrysis_carterae.AAC.3
MTFGDAICRVRRVDQQMRLKWDTSGIKWINSAISSASLQCSAAGSMPHQRSRSHVAAALILLLGGLEEHLRRSWHGSASTESLRIAHACQARQNHVRD